jgi:hypothetical protein
MKMRITCLVSVRSRGCCSFSPAVGLTACRFSVLTCYCVGQAIGDLTGVLVDSDGSETLSLIIGGLPAGDLPNIENLDDMLYIGNGEWQIDAAAVPGLMISARPNYSGENPYPALTMRAISQEIEGDESTSDYWNITFDIYPIVDGFSSWNKGATVTEAENEVLNRGVPLSNAGEFSFIDADGSEVVLGYVWLFSIVDPV